MPKVSIILPTYNGEKFIRESIESIINQTFKDWELIVVNDCSTDNTPMIVNDYSQADKRIIVINNAVNQKLPRSLNIGFAQAVGEYLTWTSDDNCYLPDALEKMVAYLEEHKNIPMVAADMDTIDEEGNITGKFASYNDRLMLYNDCVGACFLYRHEAKEEVGEYDPDWFLVEDYEYWLRILFKYGTIGHIDDTLYRYRYHGSSLTETRIADIRNQLMKLRKVHIEKICCGLKDDVNLLVRIFIEMVQKEPDGDFKHRFFDIIPFLKMIQDVDYDQNIVVYGAGDFGDKAYGILGDRIKYYVDKSEKKIGSTKNGIRIISLDEFFLLERNSQLIIAIIDNNVGVVLEELYEKGVKECCLLQLIQ